MLTLDREFFSTFVEIHPSMELQELVNGGTIQGGFNFNVNVGEEPKGGKGSREYFGIVIQEVIKLVQRRHDCESRNNSSVGNHKPDYVQRSAEIAGEHGIICLGEIKGMLGVDQEFSDQAVGQILDFLQELLIMQGWRQWVFGFLTDGVRFEFFRCMRCSDNRVSYSRSGLFSNGPAWLRLSQLLQQSNEILGFSEIIVAGWKLESLLGNGATSAVFTATSDTGLTAVCKIFISRDACAFHKNEIRALQLMSDDPHTPKIVSAVLKTGGEPSYPVLIMTPLGIPIEENRVLLPLWAYTPLVDTLRASHELGLCHIDICSDNIFAVEKGKGIYDVFLSDWGSSMLIEEVKVADKFFTHKLYYDVSRMGPSEDLAALLRSVFFLTHRTLPATETRELDRQIYLEGNWGVALKCARNGDYETVRQFFNEHRDKADLLADAFCEETGV